MYLYTYIYTSGVGVVLNSLQQQVTGTIVHSVLHTCRAKRHSLATSVEKVLIVLSSLSLYACTLFKEHASIYQLLLHNDIISALVSCMGQPFVSIISREIIDPAHDILGYPVLLLDVNRCLVD